MINLSDIDITLNSNLTLENITPAMASGMTQWNRPKSYKKGNQITCSIGIANKITTNTPVHIATLPYLPVGDDRVLFEVFNTADNSSGHGYIDVDGKIYFNVPNNKEYYCCNFIYYCK